MQPRSDSRRIPIEEREGTRKAISVAQEFSRARIPVIRPTAVRAAVLVILGACLLSFAPVFVRLAEVPPTTAGFYRMLFGALTLAGILLMRPALRAGWRSDWGASVLIAAIFAVDIWFWHRSIHYIGPGLATLLANFQVFILTLIGVFFLRERVGWRFGTGLGCATAGLWLLFGREWAVLPPDFRLGVVFGLLTAVAYALYILSLRGFQIRRGDIRTEARLVQVTVLCGLMLGGLNLLEGNDFTIPNLESLVWLVALGGLCQVGGWICITRGMPVLPAAVVGLFLLIQPSGSMVLDVLFFGLRLSPLETAGAVLALVGIYFGFRSVARRAPREPV